jgi:hypothetical protein
VKSLIRELCGVRPYSPASAALFAQEESAERLMRIAEVKWLLREIAAEPDDNLAYPDNDDFGADGAVRPDGLARAL